MTANLDDGARVVCPVCGHIHAGPELAGICVGCDCQAQPYVMTVIGGRSVPDLPPPVTRLAVAGQHPGDDEIAQADEAPPHRCHLQGRLGGTVTARTRSLCTCGWSSGWFADGSDAVDAALEHQGSV